MLTETQSQWIAALRNGDRPQTTGYLKNGTGYCCLGVAAEAVPGIASECVIYDDEIQVPLLSVEGYVIARLPPWAQDILGIDLRIMDYVIAMNDKMSRGLGRFSDAEAERRGRLQANHKRDFRFIARFLEIVFALTQSRPRKD